MTNTLPQNGTSAGSAQRPVRKGPESAIGLQRHKRTATDIGLALITPFVGQEFLDKYNLRAVNIAAAAKKAVARKGVR